MYMSLIVLTWDLSLSYVFCRMRCRECQARLGHTPGCSKYAGELHEFMSGELPESVWHPDSLPETFPFTWNPSPASWLGGGGLDPFGVLSLFDPDMGIDQVNELCDRFEEQAPLMGANEALSYVGPEEDCALRAWLEPSVSTSETLGVTGNMARPAVVLPDAWQILCEGLSDVNFPNNFPSVVTEVNVPTVVVESVEDEGDVGGETELKIVDPVWKLLRCNETNESLNETERSWPNAQDLAQTLVGYIGAEVTGDEETGVVHRGTGVNDAEEGSGRVVRFLEPPASPCGADLETVVWPGMRDQVVIPLENIEDNEGYDAEVSDLLEPPVLLRAISSDVNNLGYPCHEDEASVNEVWEDFRAGTADENYCEKSPSSLREMGPSAIQDYWSRVQRRRDGQKERNPDRVAVVRPMPRRTGQVSVIRRRADPRVFRLETRAPVVTTQTVISRVTSPNGSIAQENMNERVAMARNRATQVPRVYLRSVATQNTPRGVTIATQTETDILSGMEAAYVHPSSAVGADVTIPVIVGGVTGTELRLVLEMESTSGEDTPRRTEEESDGTPVQDEWM